MACCSLGIRTDPLLDFRLISTNRTRAAKEQECPIVDRQTLNMSAIVATCLAELTEF
jgi:hypothetical protein